MSAFPNLGMGGSGTPVDRLQQSGLAVLSEHRDAAESLDEDGPWKVSGIAMTPAVTHGGSGEARYWPEDVLRRAAERDLLDGRPIVKNFHDISGQAPADDIIGKVTATTYIDGSGLAYEGEITDREIAEKVANGYLDVSTVPLIADESYDSEREAMRVEEIAGFRDIALVGDGAMRENTVDLGSNPAVSTLSAEALSAAFGGDASALEQGHAFDALQRSEARTPAYSSTASAADRSWPDGGPGLGDYIEGYFSQSDVSEPDDGAPSEWGQLAGDAREWIAARTLLGEADAETADSGISYPVVFPDDALSEDALLSARQVAGQAPTEQAADSIRSMTQTLLENEFDRDVESNASGGSSGGGGSSGDEGDDVSETNALGEFGLSPIMDRVGVTAAALDDHDQYVSGQEFHEFFSEHGVPDNEWGSLIRSLAQTHNALHTTMYHAMNHHTEMSGGVDESEDDGGETDGPSNDGDDGDGNGEESDSDETETNAMTVHDLIDEDAGVVTSLLADEVEKTGTTPEYSRTIKDGASVIDTESNPIAQELFGGEERSAEPLEFDEEDELAQDVLDIRAAREPEEIDIEQDEVAQLALGVAEDDEDEQDAVHERWSFKDGVTAMAEADGDDAIERLAADPAVAEALGLEADEVAELAGLEDEPDEPSPSDRWTFTESPKHDVDDDDVSEVDLVSDEVAAAALGVDPDAFEDDTVTRAEFEARLARQSRKPDGADADGEAAE